MAFDAMQEAVALIREGRCPHSATNTLPRNRCSTCLTDALSTAYAQGQAGMREQVEQLRYSLKRLGRHEPGFVNGGPNRCAFYSHESCTCGLDDILRTLPAEAGGGAPCEK